ncbi:ABC transporter permease [Streptomyces cocklensis]|uniref:Peptide/nickel transport system permease protein/oligopeptide transport system permease protein n=1 Tax=Actinacidiphila cocklensis TaxID=887465 RepID=A0A9W4GNF2_9ACTN|nr:ABC transporter permease [Actinacidiphila cocklensis]MDD1062007.1 ABC transporter permease [Actinacidiphila cocklensis]WSX74749.1 ABC transporter permease [Streptomyces sp. NBC_00899]CAG6391197.1 Peptide/nickel transport system permease protein/oligopeptide transport system permease protein [Actinacidiphila cocklensis]
MGSYLLRRVLLMVPVLLGTTFVIYAAVYALPGDPVQALAGPDHMVTPAAAAAIKAHYHLGDPFLVQYWHYLVGLLHGDFGIDLNNTPVSAVIEASWPVTVKLALMTWVIEAVVGVALGFLAALRAGRATDIAVLGGSSLILGVPYFITAYVAQVFLGVKLGWFPVSGTDDGWPLSYLVPALCLALLGVPEISRLTRASILENLGADFVDTATAKGLSRARVLVRHVLRTSLIPVVSMLGTNLGYLLSGTILIEGIFNLPGLGYQVFQSVQQHDGPTVVGISTLLVLVFLLVNLVVDLLYGVLDPRIRLD